MLTTPWRHYLLHVRSKSTTETVEQAISKFAIKTGKYQTWINVVPQNLITVNLFQIYEASKLGQYLNKYPECLLKMNHEKTRT